MNYTILIIFALFFAAIGFVSALLIVRLREPESSVLSNLNRVQPDAKAGIPSPSHRVGSLQIWRDPASGALYVELDGQVYSSISQLSLEQRRLLGARAGELVNWLNQSEPRPPSSPVRRAVAPRFAVPSSGSASQQHSRNPFSRLVPFKTVPGSDSELSLADQVDEILQGKKSASPLAQRHIRLVSAPDHGLIVEVDQAQYETIGDVPDEEIRQLIQQAVAEWQRRTQRTGL